MWPRPSTRRRRRSAANGGRDDLRDQPGSRAADYALLSSYLERRSGLEVGTPVGVFANLGALGHASNEIHLPGSSLVRCQFNNVGTYWPPVDPAQLGLSTWDGTLSWATSYWR
jgi:hypothetical protein